jgi:hypothetical protein
MPITLIMQDAAFIIKQIQSKNVITPEIAPDSPILSVFNTGRLLWGGGGGAHEEAATVCFARTAVDGRPESGFSSGGQQRFALKSQVKIVRIERVETLSAASVQLLKLASPGLVGLSKITARRGLF